MPQQCPALHRVAQYDMAWLSSAALQGVMGSIPWNALLFFTLYLQLIGMSDLSASMLVSLFFGAVALGNLLGGWVGDRAASRFPNTGRIAVTQFSVFVGIPLSWLLVKVTSHIGRSSLVIGHWSCSHWLSWVQVLICRRLM